MIKLIVLRASLIRNQVLKFNLGSIDEIETFGDQFDFFQVSYAKSGAELNKLRV